MAVEPGEETIRSGAYALSRPLYWYLTAKAQAPARALLAWVQSPAGQGHVQDAGYFPAR